jgi:hypothetical protein
VLYGALSPKLANLADLWGLIDNNVLLELVFMLRHVREAVWLRHLPGATLDNWDAVFSEAWRTSDLVDCILAFTATELVRKARACCWDQRLRPP